MLEKGWTTYAEISRITWTIHTVMSQIYNNPLLQTITGMLGKTIVFRQWRGKIIVAKRPKKRKSDSKKQKIYIGKFREATQYAKKQMTIPESKAEYQTGINDRRHNAYTVALVDYLNAPKIHTIDVSNYHGAIGDTINIKATDDFRVTNVKVVIADSNGVVLEEGEAKPYGSKAIEWNFQATVNNPQYKGSMVVATALDKPMNSTSAGVVI
jgi:hypothetical protein